MFHLRGPTHVWRYEKFQAFIRFNARAGRRSPPAFLAGAGVCSTAECSPEDTATTSSSPSWGIRGISTPSPSDILLSCRTRDDETSSQTIYAKEIAMVNIPQEVQAFLPGKMGWVSTASKAGQPERDAQGITKTAGRSACDLCGFVFAEDPAESAGESPSSRNGHRPADGQRLSNQGSGGDAHIRPAV